MVVPYLVGVIVERAEIWPTREEKPDQRRFSIVIGSSRLLVAGMRMGQGRQIDTTNMSACKTRWI